MNIKDVLLNLDFYANASAYMEAAKEMLGTQLATAEEQNETLTCIILDLDRFRAITEEGGAKLGKNILATSLNVLETNVKDGTVMSMGKDSFLVYIPNIGLEESILCAETLRSAVTDAINKIIQEHGLTNSLNGGCSAGLAIYPTHTNEPPTLLGRAEEALYRSKHSGRGLTMLPPEERMILKSNYYSSVQLERLSTLADDSKRTESSLLREALDMLLRNYNR